MSVPYIQISGNLSPESVQLIQAMNNVISAINNGGIDSNCLAPGAVVTQKIAEYAVQTPQLGNEVIDAVNIRDAQILSAHIEAAQITNAHINDVSADKLTAGTIDAEVIDVVNLDATNITTGTLDADDVTVTHLHADEITVGKINGTQIADGSIDIDHLDNYLKDSVSFVLGSAHIYYQSSAPTGGTYYEGDYWFDTDDNYRAYRYTSSAWAVQSTDSGAYRTGFLVAALIAAGAVTADKIQAGTMSADRISGGTINGSTITVTNLTADNITTGTLNGARIGDGSLSYSKLQQTTADAVITVGSGKNYATPALALASIPHYVNHEIEIKVYSGTYGSIEITEREGTGLIYIHEEVGETATITNAIVDDCSCGVSVEGFTATTTTDNAFSIVNAKNFSLVDCVATAASLDGYQADGILCVNSNGTIETCTMSNKPTGINIQGGQIYLWGAAGTGNDVGLALANVVIHDGGDNTITGTVPVSNASSMSIPPSGLPVTDVQTYNPVVAGSSTAGTFTYTTRYGDYYKIGKYVICTFYIVINTVSGSPSGLVTVSLPTKVENTANLSFRQNAYQSGINIGTGATQAVWVAVANETRVRLYGSTNNAAGTDSVASSIGAGDALGGTIIYREA